MKALVFATACVALAGVNLSAHVTVQPKQVSATSSQEFLLRVPTEKDLPTTGVRVVFPEGFELMRVKAAPGWKYEFERDATGRIASVAWSGGRIGRTEYEVFSFMARAPNPGTYKLDAYQTYGENDVVGWVDTAEPRPAPQVTVVAAAAVPVLPPAIRNPGILLGGLSVIISLAALVRSGLSSRQRRP